MHESGGWRTVEGIEQVTLPDLTLRATYHPVALAPYITSITASAR